MRSEDGGQSTRFATGPEGEALRREAAVLRRAQHPGVVPLREVADTGEEIAVTVTRVVGTALGQATLTVEELVRVFAILATTTADLHHLGIAIRELRGDGVMIGEDGRPVLVDLSQATAGDRDPAAFKADDRLLGDLMVATLRRCGPLSDDRTAQVLWGAATSAQEGRASAMDVATALAGSRLRTAASSSRRLALVGLCAAAGVALVVSAIHGPERPRLRPPRAVPSTPSPTPYADGVLETAGGRFAVGRPGDVVALGRWGCEPDPTLALLRPDRGEVWTFSGWPAGSEAMTGRLVTHVVHARSITTRVGQSCDGLVLGRDDGSTVVIDPGSLR